MRYGVWGGLLLHSPEVITESLVEVMGLGVWYGISGYGISRYGVGGMAYVISECGSVVYKGMRVCGFGGTLVRWYGV